MPARVPLAVLAAPLLAAVAGAQIPSPTGSVYGAVMDEQERAVAGAAVTLTQAGAARTATTNARGDFRFLALPPGLYALELERAGFQTVRHDVVVQLGKNVVLDLTMRIAEAQEGITVLGEPPSMDNRKVETGATYDERELRELPTTRDIFAVLRQVPGVLLAEMNVGSNHGSRPIGFVGKGAHGDQNTFHLDGTGVSIGGFSPNLYDFDSFDSIGVTTGGSDPAVSTPGVTLNLVTKHGTNEIAGSARVLYADGSQWDYGVQIGGPVWKDRVWLWGAAASNTYLSQTFFLPDGEPVRSQETNKNWNAKLTAQLIPSNSLTLAYTRYERVVDGRDAAPDRSEPTTLDVTFPGSAYRAEDTHVLSENLFGSVSFSYVPNYRDAVPKGGLDAQADVDADNVWRNSYAHAFIRRTQHQVGLTASGFFATGRLRHELKFGFGYRHAANESASTWPADQLIGFAFLDPSQASITRGRNVKFLDNFYDLYLSDTLQTGDLTLNLGARFDYQQSRNLPSAVAANPAFADLLPAVQYEGDAGYPLTWRSVQPRIGATWAVGQDRHTLLRASYARFADQLGTDIVHINAFPGIANRDYYWTDTNHNGIVEPSEVDLSQRGPWGNVNPDDPGSSASVNQIAPGLDPPRTDELILGVERQIFSDLSVSLAYTYRRLSGPLFSPLIGTTRASYRYEGNASGTISDPTTGFVLDFSEPYYGLTTYPPPNGSVLENRPDTTETYDGLELRLEKSFSNGWSLSLGFAYNNWRQQIGVRAIVNPNNEVPGTNASGPIVEGDVNATWQFNIGGTVELPLGIRTGVNLFGRQGFPILYSVEVATHDTLESRPLLQIGSVTDYRTPDVYQLDLQIARPFNAGSRVQVTPVFACFNLLDNRTVLARDGYVGLYDTHDTPAFTPNEDFNAVATLGSRTIRGGVRISF